MKKFWAEFKAFITKGNVVDLAVAVVIGNAFNKIVNSLVNDVIMPLISLMIGGTNVTDWKWVIQEAQYDANGNILVAETSLKYGVFIQAIIDFLIIALTIFIIVKIYKASKARIEKIGQTIITETKELSQKQLKALKKLQKKAKKAGVNITNETDVNNSDSKTETNPNIIAEQEKTSENNNSAGSNTSKPSENDNETKHKTEVENKQAVPNVNLDTAKENDTQTSIAPTTNSNDELISLLKEIRDSLKNNQSN